MRVITNYRAAVKALNLSHHILGATEDGFRIYTPP